MTQYISWHTGNRGPTAPESVALFANRYDAQTCADRVRAQFKQSGRKATVRIMPRTVKIANVHLQVYGVVMKREAK